MHTHRTLELALDYRCNLRCVGCRACDDSGERLSGEQAAALLAQAHDRGVRTAWFGGGEPTLRDDLPQLVRRARDLGYEDVILQTNGLRLAYPAYAHALVACGVTEVRVNAKSHRADVHDRLSQVDGAHALLLTALENLAALGTPVAADVLLTVSTAGELDETIAFFADRGARRFALWLLSAADAQDDPLVAGEVPRIADLLPSLERAARLAHARGLELVSFHTPPCTLPPSLRSLWLPARDLAMTVVDPGAHTFALEASLFEGGARVDACAACVARHRCAGPRADYLALHGAAEFHELSSVDGIEE